MSQANRVYEVLSLVQGSSEWLETRKRFVTASQVPSLLGVSPYQTALQLAEEKLGKSEVISDSKKNLFERAHSCEATARKWVEDECKVAFPPIVMKSLICPDLMASLDGFNPEKNVILEAKLTGKDTLAEIREGRIPTHHMMQIQAQLLTSGAQGCIYFAVDPSDNAVSKDILPDASAFDQIQEAVHKFMKLFRDGKLPEPSERDYHLLDDPRFATLAGFKREMDSASDRFDELKKELDKDYANYDRIKAHGLLITRSVRQGSIQYAKIPELKTLDLEKYRGAPVRTFTVNLERKKSS